MQGTDDVLYPWHDDIINFIYEERVHTKGARDLFHCWGLSDHKIRLNEVFSDKKNRVESFIC